MKCQFIPAGDSRVRCAVCERTVRTAQPPNRVHAVCPGSPLPAHPLTTPCLHRGRHLGDYRCDSCGTPTRPVWACELHKRCAETQPSTGVTACSHCPDYRPTLPGPSGEKITTPDPVYRYPADDIFIPVHMRPKVPGAVAKECGKCKRRKAALNAKIPGAGDLVEKITKATGIKKVWDSAFGDEVVDSPDPSPPEAKGD